MNEKNRSGTVIVPFKGNANDDEVVHQAAMIAKRNRSTLYVVYVVVVKQELALESELPAEIAAGEAALTQANRIAHEYGVQIETGILQARSAGVAIVEEALERKATLIMMSVTYRSRRGEFNMGQTVPYILKNAPCRVWLFRDEIYKEQI